MEKFEGNLIGDIQGNYLTFLALIKQMPDQPVISLGDMIDRGPRSKEVIAWFKEHGKALLGNHEHFMIDSYRDGGYYEPGLWVQTNGGFETLKSYGVSVQEIPEYVGMYSGRSSMQVVDIDSIPVGDIEWLESLPVCMMYEGLFLSHAPKHAVRTLAAVQDLGTIGFNRIPGNNEQRKEQARIAESLIWNRGTPRRMPDYFQVFGHLGLPNYVREYKDDEGCYAMCIDTFRSDSLTGMHWPSRQIYRQKWID